MVIALIILLLLILIKSKLNLKGHFDDYISADKTLPIKGIFIIIVFLSHCNGQVSFNSFLDKPMLLLFKWLLQSIVALFFFYSGYGIYEKIKNDKNNLYIKRFPKNRLLKTWINFAIAIVSFLIIDIIIGTINNYSIKTILLSFIGWDSIGNSNWFMFVTFVLYLLIIISFNIFKKDSKKGILLTTILTIIYMFIIYKLKPTWWWDTVLCFPFGMLYSCYKEKVQNIMFKNKNYFILLTCITMLYVLTNILFKIHITIIYPLVAILFCLVIVFITMKFQINNKILTWCGKNLFWIYILQRIPMIILKRYQVNNMSYVFFIISLIITVLLTLIYSYVFDKKYQIIKK